MEQVEKRSYENSPWINVHDWMVKEHNNHETGKPFWSVKLASGTFIEHEGTRLDVGHYRFTTNVKPALTHGEAGSPKAMRGIHFPDGWEITLQRIENIAPEGHPPVFEETGRIEKVTAHELAAGIAERDAQWRATHKSADKDKAMNQPSQEDFKKEKRENSEMAL